MNNGFSIILFVYLWLIAVNIALEVINDEARDAHRPIANDYIILPIDGACCYQQLNVDSESECSSGVGRLAKVLVADTGTKSCFF